MKIELSKLSKDAGQNGSADSYFKSMFGAGPNDIVEMPIDRLRPFDNQPFKPYTEEKLKELADDISEHGVLSPVIVRPREDHYQILAGHNRVNAARLAGLPTVPCIVRDVDDSEATLIMLNTNLNQRDELLPSEKAFAYRMQLETMKRQGARTDLMPNGHKDELPKDFMPIGHKIDTLSSIAANASENRRNIARYIRLTYLIPELLELVDQKCIPFRSGVFLSYCTSESQRNLLDFMNRHKIETVTLEQAEKIQNLETESDQETLRTVFGLKEKKEGARAVSKTINIKLPAGMFSGIASRINADGELLRRIAALIEEYYRTKPPEQRG